MTIQNPDTKQTEIKEPIELQPHGLFGSRKTLEEVYEWIELHNGNEKIIGMTVYFLFWNTIANNYKLIEK